MSDDETKPTFSHSVAQAGGAVTTVSAAPSHDPYAPPTGPCVVCKARPATVWWTGDGGMLAFTHGMAEARCEVCCLDTQIDAAEKMTALLPKLRARRAELLLKERCYEDPHGGPYPDPMEG